MPSESEIIISFIFKRSGKAELDFSEIYLTLSMDLKWFTPDDAKKFVNNALKQKLLLKKYEGLRPGFEINKINVPFGFSPTCKNLDKEEYLELLLDGVGGLEERFAQVDSCLFLREFSKMRSHNRKIPVDAKKLIKKEKMPEMIEKMFLAVAI